MWSLAVQAPLPISSKTSAASCATWSVVIFFTTGPTIDPLVPLGLVTVGAAPGEHIGSRPSLSMATGSNAAGALTAAAAVKEVRLRAFRNLSNCWASESRGIGDGPLLTTVRVGGGATSTGSAGVAVGESGAANGIAARTALGSDGILRGGSVATEVTAATSRSPPRPAACTSSSMRCPSLWSVSQSCSSSAASAFCSVLRSARASARSSAPSRRCTDAISSRRLA
mmetsp:Transcript_89238/g.177428  ORF Transcript_89238/g.177428 Transcript_89238/m.177428 type:complete len:226 (+) Transcript_89238:67-744(+)